MPDRDWFDWVNMVAVAVVTPVATFIAAKYGIERGAALSRNEEDKRQKAHDERELVLLLRRLNYDVDVVIHASMSIKEEQPQSISPRMPMLQDMFDAMLRAYHDNRAAVLLVADREVQDAIEDYYSWVMASRADVVGWYEEERLAANSAIELPDTRTSPRGVWTRLLALAERGRRLMAHLERAYPQYALVSKTRQLERLGE